MKKETPAANLNLMNEKQQNHPPKHDSEIQRKQEVLQNESKEQQVASKVTSNGINGNHFLKQEIPQKYAIDFSLDVPLRKTLSSPNSHPLFGSLNHKEISPKTDLLPGPCWYMAGDSQLQKRKPEEISSHNSSSKRFIKPPKSGLEQIKSMGKRLG